jgi:hypothetical protein
MRNRFVCVAGWSGHFDCKGDCSFQGRCIFGAWDFDCESWCVVNVTIGGIIKNELVCFAEKCVIGKIFSWWYLVLDQSMEGEWIPFVTLI